jgi:hypothetical protein
MFFRYLAVDLSFEYNPPKILTNFSQTPKDLEPPEEISAEIS